MSLFLRAGQTCKTPSMEILERGLVFSLGLLDGSLGHCNAIVLEFRRSLIQLLRRTGNLTTSETLCTDQICSSELLYGSDSFHTIRARSELVHIHAAGGRYDSAMSLCEDVLQCSRQGLETNFLMSMPSMQWGTWPNCGSNKITKKFAYRSFTKHKQVDFKFGVYPPLKEFVSLKGPRLFLWM